MPTLTPTSPASSATPLVRRLLAIVKAFLGLGLLVITLWRLDWKAVGESFQAVQPGWVAAGLASVLLTLGLKFLRWILLLRSEGLPLRWARLWEAYFIGQAANILLPFRGGEVIRFSWAIPGAGPNSGILAASIFLEKYLDLLGLTVLTSFLVLDQPDLTQLHSPSRWALLAGCGILVISALWIAPYLWKRGLNRLGTRWRWFARLHVEIDRLMDYCRTIRQVRRLVVMLGFTVLIWLIMIATNILVMRATAIPLSFHAATAVVVLIYIGGIPALMPGNIGPFYFFASLGLTLYGVKAEPALTFAIVLHALVTLPSLLAAGLSLLIQLLRMPRGSL